MFFTVGPAQLYHGVADFYQKILAENWASFSHRSEKFSKMSEEAIFSFKKFFCIPEDYGVYYTSSATESLEIAVQNLVEKKVCHVSQGSFGDMWMNLSEMAQKEVQKYSAQKNFRHSLEEILPEKDAEMLCITANETSTGIAYSNEDIKKFHQKFPETLLAVDATSSMGAVQYDFSAADVWAFSVQKAMGLPAGLGILILSPKAKEKAMQQNFFNGRHSIKNLEKKMAGKFQTPSTPNVLAIAALGFVSKKLAEDFGTIENLNDFIEQKFQFFCAQMQEKSEFFLPVSNETIRSKTIFVVENTEEKIANKKTELSKNGFEVSSGYGDGKKTQLRIANFPVHSQKNLEELIQFF